MMMIKKILFIAIVIVFSSCVNTETENYPNGRIKSEIHKQGDKYEGISRWWYDNGNLKMEVNYKDNKVDGYSRRWFYNGKIESEEFYVADKRNGVSRLWNSIGNKISEENYVNDTLDGAYRLWYNKGQIKIEGGFKKGMYNGKWTWWNEMGVKVGEADFVDGSGVQVGWFLNGNKKREVHYKNNIKNGKEIIYSSNGDIEKVIINENGIVVSEKNIDIISK